MSVVPPPPGPVPDARLHVHALNLEAQGVARGEDGRVVFVDGALPGERVTASIRRKKERWQAAQLVAVERASAQRVTPPCPHFGLHAGACGGCKMQHLHPAAQVAIKQRVLEDDFCHLVRLRPETILPPVHGPSLGYRFRARLSVRFVARKGRVLIGFHERNSRYIADMQQCRVLPAHVSRLLPALQEFMASLGARESCPQIELACTDAATALVLRHLLPLTAQDLERLAAFAAAHRVQWWLQAKGPDSAHPLCPDDAPLSYSLPEFGLNLAFRPTDFTQVNPFINQVLVSRALRLLDVRKDESVIDWFCGLGNFSLALATRAGRVLGVEGSAALVRQAQGNYEANVATGTALAPTTFALDNLFEASAAQLLEKGWVADKWLIDPPREGAFALCKALADLHQDGHAHALPRRVVYVSCNPATLARDAGLLVHRAGYRCTAAGVVNMFPHTAHVESVAAFERSA